MKEFFKEIGNDTLKKVRESADSHMNDAFFDGYNTAANICVDVITKNIHELFSQINSGSFLSDQEQFLLSKLNFSIIFQNAFDFSQKSFAIKPMKGLSYYY